eukprot:3541742-Pyramimonas_sp.AAC.1
MLPRVGVIGPLGYMWGWPRGPNECTSFFGIPLRGPPAARSQLKAVLLLTLSRFSKPRVPGSLTSGGRERVRFLPEKLWSRYRD